MFSVSYQISEKSILHYCNNIYSSGRNVIYDGLNVCGLHQHNVVYT